MSNNADPYKGKKTIDGNPHPSPNTRQPPGFMMTPNRTFASSKQDIDHVPQVHHQQQQHQPHRQFVSYAAAANSPGNNTPSSAVQVPSPHIVQQQQQQPQYDKLNQQQYHRRNTKSNSPVRGGDGFSVFDQPPQTRKTTVNYTNNKYNHDIINQTSCDKKSKSPGRGLSTDYNASTPSSNDTYRMRSSPTIEMSNGRQSRNRSHSPNRGQSNYSNQTKQQHPNHTHKSQSPAPSNHHYNRTDHNNIPSKPIDMVVLVTRTDLYDGGGLATTDVPATSSAYDNNDADIQQSPMPYHGYSNLSSTPPKQHHKEHFNNTHQQGIPNFVEYSWQSPPAASTENVPAASTDILYSPNKSKCCKLPTISTYRVPPCPLPNVVVDPSYADDAVLVAANNNKDDDALEDGQITNTDAMKQLLDAFAKKTGLNTSIEDEHAGADAVFDDPSKSSKKPALATPSTFSNPGIMKYWNQRRRLFSRFDRGIQLDEEGWFSVTPEQIATHVAHRMVEMVQWNNQNSTSKSNSKITVLDAFCGCGGNAIAFAKLSQVDKVICIDLDREKLQRAANNAYIYDIPGDKIVFLECNALFVMQHCYRDGLFVLDEPLATPEAAMDLMASMPPPVPTTTYKTFHIGGIDLLPRSIDVVFLDPPWGGVDYAVLGKNGYDLRKNMKIQRPVSAPAQNHQDVDVGSGLNDFFDTFQTHPRNRQERVAQFNCGMDEVSSANGAELLAIAASATSRFRQVIYDVPRNTNRISIGESAIEAGYHGNVKVEEHYINGRLKTITAYFGRDWRPTLLPASDPTDRDQPHLDSSTDTALLHQPILNHLEMNTIDPDKVADMAVPAIVPTTTVFLPFLPNQGTR